MWLFSTPIAIKRKTSFAINTMVESWSSHLMVAIDIIYARWVLSSHGWLRFQMIHTVVFRHTGLEFVSSVSGLELRVNVWREFDQKHSGISESSRLKKSWMGNWKLWVVPSVMYVSEMLARLVGGRGGSYYVIMTFLFFIILPGNLLCFSLQWARLTLLTFLLKPLGSTWLLVNFN